MGCSSSSPATPQDEKGSVEPESFSFKRTASSYENGESFSRRIVVSNEDLIATDNLPRGPRRERRDRQDALHRDEGARHHV